MRIAYCMHAVKIQFVGKLAVAQRVFPFQTQQENFLYEFQMKNFFGLMSVHSCMNAINMQLSELFIEIKLN